MNQHSIIEHRANYYFITLQDDYLAMYEQLNEKIQAKIDHDKDIKGSDYKGKNAPAPSDCKAMITSVLEHWMNSLRIKSKNDNDLWMNFTYEEWEGQLRGCYKRSTIIQCLQEMQEDRDEDGDRVIKTRPYKQNIHSYQLNIPVIQKLLNDLPAQSPYGSKPRPKLGRPSKICSQKNGFKTDGISVNPSENKYNLKTDGLTIKPSENKPINDKYRLKTNDEPSENKRYFHDETSSQAVSSAPIDYIQITNTYISNTQIKEESVRPPTSTPQPSLEEVSSSDNRPSLSSSLKKEIEKNSSQPPTEKKPRTRTVKKDAPPQIVLTEEEQRVYDYYCHLWFVEVPPRITEDLKAHCAKLCHSVKSQEDMDSLEKFARANSHFKSKVLYLGNLVNAVNGWKQTKPQKPSSSTAPAPTAVFLNEQQASQLATRLVASAQGKGHEIQARPIETGNGAFAVEVMWNTPSFERPIVLKSEKRLSGMYREMCQIWEDSKEKVK